MGAVLLLARSRLHRHWRGVLIIGLVVAIAGGVLLTALAGARRTSSAVARLGDETDAGTAAVDLPGVDHAVAARIGRLPGVERWAEMAVWAASVVDRRRAETPIVIAVDGHFGRTIDRSILVAGRRARNPHEIVLSRGVAERRGYHVGSALKIATYAPRQLEDLRTGKQVAPEGATIPMKVVGLDRRVGDLSLAGERTGVIFLDRSVYRDYGSQTLAYVGLVRLRIAPGHQAEVARGIRAVARITGKDIEVDTGGFDATGVVDALGVLGFGLVLFAIIGALGMLVTVTVLLSRWSAGATADQPIEHALGLDARRRTLAVALPVLPAVAAGALGAVVIALLASPLMPVGAARPIEPHPGFDVDALVLGLGFVALVIVFGSIAFVTAALSTRASRWESTRRTAGSRRSRWLAALTRWRLPVPAVIGSRMAVDPGRGATAVPGRSAIGAAAVGIAGIVAAVVVGTSMHRLVTEPSRYAYHYDAIVESGARLRFDPDSACGPVHTPVSRLPQVAALANLCSGTLDVGGRSVAVTGLGHIRGTIRPTILRGRAPVGTDEIALGETTLDAIHRAIGDRVVVRGEHGRIIATIVGTTFSPSPNSHDTVSLADGALLAAPTIARLTPGTFPQVVIRWRPGVDLARAQAEVRRITGAPTIAPVRPPEVDRLLQVDDLPAILAAFLAFLAVVSVTYAVATTVRRRRRELALLRTLGFRGRQLVETIASQAVTLALFGLVLGIPMGVVIGRIAWSRVADSVGLAGDASIPWPTLIVAVPVVLVLVLALAAIPARAAARLRPAVALRSE